MSACEKRNVPCEILDWPGVAPLVWQYKFIFVEIWYNPGRRLGGRLLYDFDATAERLGITAASLRDAVTELQRRGLVDFDFVSGELSVVGGRE